MYVYTCRNQYKRRPQKAGQTLNYRNVNSGSLFMKPTMFQKSETSKQAVTLF